MQRSVSIEDSGKQEEIMERRMTVHQDGNPIYDIVMR